MRRVTIFLVRFSVPNITSAKYGRFLRRTQYASVTRHATNSNSYHVSNLALNRFVQGSRMTSALTQR